MDEEVLPGCPKCRWRRAGCSRCVQVQTAGTGVGAGAGAGAVAGAGEAAAN
jgi:hypothetical protein